IEYCPLSNKDSFQSIMVVFYSLRQGTLEFMIDMIFGINKINRYSIQVFHPTLHNALHAAEDHAY
ncbi:MAG: hypothetical protein WA220_04980, partial [Candidatus Nitrosopolaris sp.]